MFDSAGTIGRSPGNDWVLPDPDRFMSGQHAAISCENGCYHLTDLSTNGTIVNGDLLTKGSRVQLKSGDRITLGNYEIDVLVEEGFGVAAPQHGVPLFGQAPDRPVSVEPMAGREGSLDPLDFFGPPQPKAPTLPATEPDHVPSHAEFFAPPSVHPDPLLAPPSPPPAAPLPPTSPPQGGAIPENWDDTSFTAQAPADASDPFAPDDWQATRLPRGPAAVPTPGSAAAPGALGAGVAAPAGAAGAAALSGPAVPSPASPSPASPPPAPPAAPAAAPPAAPAAAPPAAPGGAASLDALLRGAGLDPATVDARTLASLGEVLGVVVDGLLEVLRARAAIKNQFRVAMTTLKPVENNPLKFSASVEDALHNLFVRRGQSYLPPVDAFREAFDDLKAHQLALMAGMRAAFGTLLARFDPDRLQEGFDKGLKRSALLDVINKTKYWELYREMYSELGDDDATFRRLFGDEFAQAYEEQMQRLAAQARQRQ